MQRVRKRALVTGVAGQDGSYLAELLLSKEYEVHGVVRAPSSSELPPQEDRLGHLREQVQLHAGLLDSVEATYALLERLQPDEVYHLAGESFVSHRFEAERRALTNNVNTTHLLLSALKEVAPRSRFCFAGSSEMFGRAVVQPQDEDTPFHPRSAYGVSKVAGFHLTRQHRESLGLHASSAILFNHESPRRGAHFVTRKITRAAAAISLGLQQELRLGNLDARRDWGHAQDFVEAMWSMLQQSQPQDYVLATGVAHSVRDFCQLAFARVGLESEQFVRVDEALFRPADQTWLVGHAARARQQLGFAPKRSFEQLVAEMVDADLAWLQRSESR